MAIPQLRYLRDTQTGTPVITNNPVDLVNSRYQTTHGNIPRLAGGSTPQERYTLQQQNEQNQTYNQQQMALANARGVGSIQYPQLTSNVDQGMMERDLSALGKDMSVGTNRINAKYAGQRLNQMMDENARQQNLQAGMFGQGLDMAKFNASQAAEQQAKQQQMDFAKQQQQDQFGHDFELTGAKNAADLQNTLLQLGMKPKPLTPYEEAKQKAQAAKDVEMAGKQAEYGKTQAMLNPATQFGANIDDLIKKSTGSTMGSAVDTAARAVGIATPGAKANSELATFANQLIMQMPRGSGPQSDRDMALAAAMAGDLANPNKTVEEKQAALKGVRNYYDTVLGSGAFDKMHGVQAEQGQQSQQQTSQQDYGKPSINKQWHELTDDEMRREYELELARRGGQ